MERSRRMAAASRPDLATKGFEDISSGALRGEGGLCKWFRVWGSRSCAVFRKVWEGCVRAVGYSGLLVWENLWKGFGFFNGCGRGLGV